ncbi:Toprim-like [Candidatus Fervidibacteria bacterium JGI MDM2 JNZ-1-D12]
MNLLELVGRFTDLKPTSSGEWRGRCPFPDHNDENPSFYLHPQREVFFCFGCGRGGGIRTFKRLMGLKDEEFDASLLSSIHDVLISAQNFFRDSLSACLKKDRSIEQELEVKERKKLVREFSLGYADANSSVIEHLIRQFPEELIIKSGLAYRSSNRLVALFRRRITIPIFQMLGGENSMLVGFAARAIGDAQPKYLNTPESPLFRKREILFLAPKVIPLVRGKDLYIVEGYFDAMQLTLHLSPAVAIMSSNLTLQQARKILNSKAKRIVLCFDGDDAGLMATASAAALLLSLGVRQSDVLAVLLPDGVDPEDAVLKTELRVKLRNPLPILDALTVAVIRKPEMLQRLATQLTEGMLRDICDNLKGKIARHVLVEVLQTAKKSEQARSKRRQFISESLQFDEPTIVLLYALANSIVPPDDPRVDVLFPILHPEAQRFIQALRDGKVEDNNAMASLYARLMFLPLEDFLIADIDAAFSKLFQRLRKFGLQQLIADAVEAKKQGNDTAIAELEKRWQEISVWR